MIYSIKRFSEKEKTGIRDSLILGGSLTAADISHNIINQEYVKKLNRDLKKTSREEKKIYRKLKSDFRKRKNTLLKEGIDYEGNIVEQTAGGLLKDSFGNKHKYIQIQGNNVGNASVLGHELGHIHYLTDKNAKKLGKYAHKLRGISDNSTLIGFGTGFASGINSAKKEDKESKLSRVSGGLTAVTSNIPRLIAEQQASKYGYNLLKQSGASKEHLSKANKNYKRMLLTYGTGILGDIGAAELGRAAGKYIAKSENK